MRSENRAAKRSAASSQLSRPRKLSTNRRQRKPPPAAETRNRRLPQSQNRLPAARSRLGAGGRMSVAEMMAAARAEKAAAAAAAAAEAKPAAAKPAAAKPAARESRGGESGRRPKRSPAKACGQSSARRRPNCTVGQHSGGRSRRKAGADDQGGSGRQTAAAAESRSPPRKPSWPCRRCRQAGVCRAQAKAAAGRRAPRRVAVARRFVAGARFHGTGGDRRRCGRWLTARFMFPNILNEPPSQFQGRSADSISPGQVETKYVSPARVDRQLRIQRQEGNLRPAHRLHALGLHAELAGRRTEIQMPLPRQRLLQGRHQFRRAGSAAAGAVSPSASATTASWKSTRARRSRKKSGSGPIRQSFVPV